MAEYILDVLKQTSKLDWAFPFQRTGAFPLDRSSLFSSYVDAVLYASGAGDERQLGGSSYIGQPISVYDATNNTVTLYLIEADRTLKEVGSVPIGDNVSIEVIDNTLQLKNFGTGYYKYVAAVKNEETGEIITPSSYEYTEGFVAGLEPRVINSNGHLEIAWYEPSEETIEGVSAKVASLEKTLEEKADKSSVYTKAETDNAISTAISGADHLRRKIVNKLEDISETAEDAHLYIYMVPTGLQQDDDKYDEYVVIDGILEKVGSWEVDLSNYATKEEVKNLSDKVDDHKEELDEKILNLQKGLKDETDRATAAEAANAEEIAKKADKSTTLAGYGITDTYTKDEITGLISDITGGESAADVKAELTAFKTTTETALQSIQSELKVLAGAEPNFIVSVDSDNFAVENGHLELISVSPSQVDGLQAILDTGVSLVSLEEKEALQRVLAGDYVNLITSVSDSFLITEGELQLVSVPQSALIDVVGDITQLVNYTEGTTIVNEINDIRALLAWQELENS